MLRRHDVTGARPWSLSRALACVVALCLVSTLAAADPGLDQHPPVEPSQPRDACRMAGLTAGLGNVPQTGTFAALGALFVTEPREYAETCRMVGLAVGAAAGSQNGGFAPLGTLLAGKHPRWDAWAAQLPLANRFERVTLGAATLLANGSGFCGLDSALRLLGTFPVGQYALCWLVLDTDDHLQMRIPRRYLEGIEDGPAAGVGGREVTSYAVFLRYARTFTDRAFSKAVRHDLTSVHLMESPERNRGEVVRVTGQLLRINRYDPTWEAEAAGVRDVYEAWIFSETISAQPYCVQFTDWPEGLPKEYLGKSKIDNPPRVTADAYFFKRLKYFSQDGGNRQREAPLAIGHTIRIGGPAVVRESPSTWLAAVVAALIGLVGFMVAAVIGLSWWWRRNDDKLRKRLLAARSPEFIMPPPDVQPALAVAVPVHKSGEGPPRFTFPPELGDRPGESGPPGKSGDRGSTEEEPPEDAGA